MRHTYNISDDVFAQWIDAHPDCDELVFQPRYEHEGIHSSGIHIFTNEGRFGYCKQFARHFSGCIYKSVREVEKNVLEVSYDGVTFMRIRC